MSEVDYTFNSQLKNLVKILYVVSVICSAFGASFFEMPTFYPLDLRDQEILNTASIMVGRRFARAFPDENIKRNSSSNSWSGNYLNAQYDNIKNALIPSYPLLLEPVILTYNGINWPGYGNKEGRTLPVLKDVWK